VNAFDLKKKDLDKLSARVGSLEKELARVKTAEGLA